MKNKTKQYKLLTLSVILLLTSAVNYCNAENVDTSTIAFKNDMEAVEFLAENGNQTSLAMVFDGATPMKNSTPVMLAGVWPGASGANSSANTPVSSVQQKGLKLSAAVPKLGLGEPAKKQKSLDGFQTTSDGNLYRVRNDRPWWKFWDSSKVIEKSIPNANDATWNENGEFVGEWQKVMKTDADRFQVMKGADSNDHIYTFKKSGWWSANQEVYKDGKFVTSFKSNIEDSYLTDVKTGKDEKIYARYKKDAEDIIIGVDPSTKKQTIVSKVPAELSVHYRWHSETYTDSEGNTHTREYREEYVERDGVTKFDVTKDGKVLTLFKGNVFEEGNQRKMLAGVPVNPNDAFSDKTAWGKITEFKVDSYGNLYTVDNGRVVVNNELGTINWQSSRDLNVDDHGNIYKVDWAWDGSVIRQVNLINDPANGKHIAGSSQPA